MLKVCLPCGSLENRGSKKLKISDAAWKKNLLTWYLQNSGLQFCYPLRPSQEKGLKMIHIKVPKWRNRKASPYHHDILSFNPDDATAIRGWEPREQHWLHCLCGRERWLTLSRLLITATRAVCGHW